MLRSRELLAKWHLAEKGLAEAWQILFRLHTACKGRDGKIVSGEESIKIHVSFLFNRPQGAHYCWDTLLGASTAEPMPKL